MVEGLRCLDREGGELRPKGPTVGKEKPPILGMFHGHSVLLKGPTGDTFEVTNRIHETSANCVAGGGLSAVGKACRAAKLCATRGCLSGFQSGEKG